MKLIHYGHSSFDKDLFHTVCNQEYSNKPAGGFWTSPVGSEHGWKEWCTSEEFEVGKLSCYCIVEFRGRLCVVDSVRDMLNLPWKAAPIAAIPLPSIDFESLASDYDAMFLTRRGQAQTRHTHPESLYGWDCESVLVFNPDCITNIEEGQEKH